MSTTTIIIAVSAALAVLVIVVFTLQQLEKSNREKQAQIASLKTRLRNFQYLLDGFPEGFLSRDLRALVCRCLLDALEELMKFEPRAAQHKQEHGDISARLQQIKIQPPQGTYQPLADRAQIQEVQRLLTSLYNVVQKLAQRKRLPANEAAHYTQEISALTMRVALDSHLQAAQQALASGKPRLAVHYYGLAIDKMRKNNGKGLYSAQLQLCEQRVLELEQVAEHQPAAEEQAATPEGWKEFGADPEGWKKKSVYD